MYDDDDQKQSKPVFFHKYKHSCMTAMPLLVSIGNIKYLIKRRNTEKKVLSNILYTHQIYFRNETSNHIHITHVQEESS